MRTALAAVARGAPDPADARRRCERIADAGGLPADLTDDEIQVLTLACQRAPYLATLLARDPGRLRRVGADRFLRREKPRATMAAELQKVIAAGPDLSAALRRYRADEMVRLGAREFGLGRDVEVGRELAHLAEVSFDAAIAAHRAELVERWGEPTYTDDAGGERPLELAVIGMGKLGGEELNFTSDVDVIYVYSSDAGSAGERSLHEFASEWCRRVTAAIGEVTDDEFVFRVDLRLRPEGSRGAIANSLLSTERYYESWGRPWERQAWLKARACAGSIALGEEVLDILAPFIYSRQTTPAVVAHVVDFNRRIKAELDTSTFDRGYDVKNGVGGIREIEFFVQALQLIHAGHRPALRTKSTLGTLDQLLFAGIVTDTEHRTLVDAYRFLRHVEHALQLESGRQTQRLPSGGEPLELVARRLIHAPAHADAAAFRTALAVHTTEIARLFATLGVEEDAIPPQVWVLLDPEAGDERVHAALAELGFRDVDQAAHNLFYARRKPASPLGPTATGAAERVAPAVLVEIAASPDPDQALGFLVDLISKRGSWSEIWRLFDDNRALIRLVASLMGTSAYLARAFVNHPELIDALLQAGRARASRAPDDLRATLADRLAGVDPDDEEAQWSQLAAFKQAQVLRVGLADVAGDLEPTEVCTELSSLAEVCLQRAFDFVHDKLVAVHGAPTGELAVLGLGKLGSRELGYASDLDIIFVYSEEGTTTGRRPLANSAFMTRLAQRLVSALHAMHPSGRLYETDTRLRPEGSKGLLVSSFAGWRRYHDESARLWERQALIKLRPVAGDSAFGERVAEVAASHVYGSARETPAEIATAVRDMRDRIEAELATKTPGIDIKAGRGGLIDVEFAAQFLQLVHGGAHPALRARATIAALEVAAREGIADRDACTRLADGYRFLRGLEHRLRIVHDRSEHRLPTDPAELDKLARRLRYPTGDALVDDYRRRAAEIRAAYEAIVHG